MNANITMQQTGLSEVMAEARLSFKGHKTIKILIKFFSFLKCAGYTTNRSTLHNPDGLRVCTPESGIH
jgi:hypothetical protein